MWNLQDFLKKKPQKYQFIVTMDFCGFDKIEKFFLLYSA